MNRDLGFPVRNDGGFHLVTTVRTNELKTIVLDRKRPALVLFSGAWCGDCMNLKPTWDAWVGKRRAAIYQVEVARGAPEWKEWSIDEIPTVVAFMNGTEVDRAHGVISSEDLERLWKRLKTR